MKEELSVNLHKKILRFTDLAHVYITYLDVLGETFIELLVVLLVLSQLGEELQTLLDDVLTDDFEDLALLQHFSGDVEGQVLGVHNTTDKVWRLTQNRIT